MQDVADTLRALEADARDLRAEAAAEDLASRSLEITKKQFAAGGVSQQQHGGRMTLTFTSQFGVIDLAALPVVDRPS